MGRTCTICAHDEGHSINVALVHREPYRAIASRYGVSKPALQRHATEHLPDLLVKAKEATEQAAADNLLRQIKDLQSKTLSLLLQAEEAGELRTALAGVREARGNVELLAKLSGDLDERPQVNVLIASHVQQVIVEALRPYPEAGWAVAQALGRLEPDEAF